MHRIRFLLFMTALAFCATVAPALINPNFTPIHLVGQSEVIADVRFRPVKEGMAVASVKDAAKGKPAANTLSFNLKASAYREQTTAVEKLIQAHGDKAALFFTGKIQSAAPGGVAAPGGAEPPADDQAEKAFLHIGCVWVSFLKGADQVWQMDKIDADMLGTWNGDTETLHGVVEYILADPAADVPCVEGARWAAPQKFATLTGRVSASLPVSLSDRGEPALLLAGASGDHLYVCDAKGELLDITATHKLTTHSTVAGWGDLDGNGRYDLVSWDGEALAAWMQDDKGVFRAGSSLSKATLPDGCLSLAVIDTGTSGRAAILVGTAAMPLLWSPDRDKSEAVLLPIAVASSPAAAPGAAGRCLVADFDGDGLPDILQLFVKGSRLFRGEARGRFATPAPCAIALGPGPSDAFLGDYDGDGRFDVFTLGDAVRLWVNRGQGVFEDLMTASGELSYKGNTDANGGMTGDFNGDGRQDLALFHPAASPNLYFNRGFRSFGLANDLDFQKPPSVLPAAAEGVQTGCWADLDGDGTQELVIVLTKGECWRMAFDTHGEKGRGVRVAATSGSASGGPVTVRAVRGKVNCGAWNVVAGAAEAFFGTTEAGPVTLKWQAPGGKPQSRDVVVENALVRFVLP